MICRGKKKSRVRFGHGFFFGFEDLMPGDNGINKEFPGRVPHGNAAFQIVSADLFGVRVCLANDLAGVRDKGPFSEF